MKLSVTGLVIFLLLLYTPGHTQTGIISSLKKEIAAAKNEEEKIKAIFRLCEERLSLHSDTLKAYATKAAEIARKQKNDRNMLWAGYYLSTLALKNGQFDSTLAFCDAASRVLKTNIRDEKLITSVSMLKAVTLIRSSRFKEALSFMFSLLHEYEKQTDTLTIIKIKSSIGWVNMEMNQSLEAMDWFYKAFQTSSNENLFRSYTALFSNIASTLNNLGKYDSGFFYINKSVEYGRQTEQLTPLANALNIRADLYTNTGNTAAAEKDLSEALEIRKKIGDMFYVVSDLAQLASFYASTGQHQKGIAIAQEGLAIAQEQKLDAKFPFLYRALAENYRQKGEYKQYAATLETLLSLKDSLYKKNSAQALAELQTNYDLQKKENLIIQQRFELKQQTYLFYASLLLVVFASLAGWLLFKDYRRKEKLKQKHLQEEEKIQAAISITRAEENERRRIAADLHDNIGAYASAIRADVEKISGRDFEKNTIALENLRQHSQEIINSLRDTIWVLNKNNITITGVSDRIKNYISKLQPSYPHIQLQLTEEIIDDQRISSQHALNMFRIIQEAVHNALRHSNASNIQVHISSSENICISVRDDGDGIKNNNTDAGNGLSNMQARSHEIGMQLTIKTGSGKGTVLHLKTGTTN